MKTKTLILWLLLSVTIPSFAYDFQSGDLCYNITGPGTVEVTRDSINYYEGLTDIVIPESVTYNGTTYSVTTIGNASFNNCIGLTSVTIPNSVTTIGEGAFLNCTGLTSVTIPNSVTSIGSWAFNEVCNIVYSGTATGSPWGARSVNGYVEGYLVYSDSAKTTLLACSSTATESITIPDGVTSIGNFAFSWCTNLTSVTVPNSVTTIGYEAFQDVFYVVYSGTATGSPWGAKSVNGYVEGYLVYSDSTKTALQGCSTAATGAITIPGSVTSIGDGAFIYCTGLTSITIPDGVTTIGDYAFYGCNGLTSVTIPNSVTSIGMSAFRGCRNLTSITIPNSVTYIDCWAFHETPWYENQQDGVVYINNILYHYKGTMPQGTNIVIKDGTTMIVTSAFLDCTGLTSVTIPNSVTNIGGYAFSGCTSLTSAVIPDGVTNIGDYAFDDCTDLTSVTIPNSVTSIGMSAFYGCTGLTSITIPNKVRMIGTFAFTECTALTAFTCYAIEPPTILTYNGTDGVPLESMVLYVPEESIEEYRATEWWKDFKEIRAIGATSVEADEPILTPEENKVTITWPTADNADTYTIDIHEDDVLISTLTFDANGVLQSMRFAAPSRYATQHTTQAEATNNGFCFVVEGLDYSTTYTYSITVTDKDETVLTTYSGTFTTKTPTGTEVILSAPSQPTTRKVFRDGQVYILRGGKTYNINGTEVR